MNKKVVGLFIVVFSLFYSLQAQPSTDNEVEIIPPDTNFVLDDHSFDLCSDASKAEYVDSTSLGDVVLCNDTLALDTTGRNIRNPKVAVILSDSLYWKSVASSYVIFDSMRVNPYPFDGSKYEDTLLLQLCSNKMGVGDYCLPVKETYATSKFGWRRYRWHYGTDLELDIGDSVVAVFDGVVRMSKVDPRGYGNYVVVRHYNGLETLYGHLDKRLVDVGDEVRAGDLIGWGGNTGRSTGPHLHFEVRYQGNAIDPEDMFDFEHECIKDTEYSLCPDDYEYLREMKRRKYYRVRSGDYLGKIAARHHTTISSLCRLNGIRRSSILRVGQMIRVR